MGIRYIDEQYKRLLNNLFSKEWVDQYIAVSPNGWISVLDKFRAAKSKFFVNPKMTEHEIELPLEFLSFLEDKMEEKNEEKAAEQNLNGHNTYQPDDLESFVNRIRVDFKSKGKKNAVSRKNLIQLQDTALILATELWKSLFNSVINPIIKHCEQLLESEFLDNVQFMCLVGGLAASKYLQKRIRKAFGMDSVYRFCFCFCLCFWFYFVYYRFYMIFMYTLQIAHYHSNKTDIEHSFGRSIFIHYKELYSFKNIECNIWY